MSKLLAVDLDGTLFYPRNFTRCISKKNVKFLRKWIDAGNRVVLISSRSYGFVKELEKEVERPIDFISSTGAQIVADGELKQDLYLNNEHLKSVLDDIVEKFQPLGFLASGKDKGHIIKVVNPVSKMIFWVYHLWWFFQFKYREKYLIGNKEFDDFIANGKVCKIMVFYGLKKNKAKLSKEINKELRDKYNDIEVSWTAQVNEITPHNCNKSAGLHKYCELMNVAKEDVYVVGDSGNDISMFNDFHEHSFCMRHSYPSVKKYASHIISRVYKLDKIVLKGEN